MQEILDKHVEKMEKSLENLKGELTQIRAGRANPHILDGIKVDYYGTPIAIQPWDGSMLKEIEHAINEAEIGINPTNDGKVIRLVFPELTEDRRKDLVKDIKKLGENAKVAIRNIRRDGMDHIKKKGKEDGAPEDTVADFEDELQEATDKYVKKVDEAVKAKSDEVMTV